ncbi:MAG: hypothetical protein KDD66_01490 [Bdellovibrionales bacterium]|nr:hypothetical protein [Bdellovibrionales bacterium]
MLATLLVQLFFWAIIGLSAAACFFAWLNTRHNSDIERSYRLDYSPGIEVIVSKVIGVKNKVKKRAIQIIESGGRKPASGNVRF